MPPKGPLFNCFSYFATNCSSKKLKGPPFTILKTLHFLSLRYSADFGHSRLVYNQFNNQSFSTFEMLIFVFRKNSGLKQDKGLNTKLFRTRTVDKKLPFENNGNHRIATFFRNSAMTNRQMKVSS